MSPKWPSVVGSEDELDISKLLAASDDHPQDSTGEKKYDELLISQQMIPYSAAAGIDFGEDAFDNDEEYIAAQQAASNRKASNVKGKSVKKGGGFQAMGLNSRLLRAISRKGFSVPTPIQRKTIPTLLEGRDVVGMARTGSGKTAAFVIPMIEKLKDHSAKFGARALVLSPSRELALQTLKVVKELSRGTTLKLALLVGGDSMEEQFGFVASNPDIIIATPGRFMHLQVEMSLNISSIRYAVFDEADRLFEMGFAAQLTEILHSLPMNRQTLLFSATLPTSLVEFAKAGLVDPCLIRLDAETKTSPDLESAFFTLQSSEKEGALLHILLNIIQIPTGPPSARDQEGEIGKKRKQDDRTGQLDSPTEHSTIVFVATKHHVEYLATLLRVAGFAVSHAYGALDQTARKIQVQDFRSGRTNILVVTDVAARGIDIPVLANVINYDFPPQAKIFVHRVGRTARAGKRGWSYSLVRDSDVPYMLDLQLFLGRPLMTGRSPEEAVSFANDMVIGSLMKEHLASSLEWVAKLIREDGDISGLQEVSIKAEKQYNRTRKSASLQSVKRTKTIIASDEWRTVNALFKSERDNSATARDNLLSKVSSFRPNETVFEMGKHGGNGDAADVVKRRRIAIESKRAKQVKEPVLPDRDDDSYSHESEAVQIKDIGIDGLDLAELAQDRHALTPPDATQSCNELQISISMNQRSDLHQTLNSWEDSEHYMKYTPSSINVQEEQGYGVHSSSNMGLSSSASFAQAARGATMDLTLDQGSKSFGDPSQARGMRWDKKAKKYVARANDEDGSKKGAMIRGESGQRISASFKSGRFDSWKSANKVKKLPRVGELESKATPAKIQRSRFKHKSEQAPKAADRYRDDFKKQRQRVNEAKEKRVGIWKDGAGKSELRSTSDVHKQRKMEEKRRSRSGRPSKPRKG
ncbi:MAG: ATP-dependent RNA helicase dbp10 [Vezdaea aestivalis]|nr:MAG: ATP-dependent RNA helicase dbp10 [Vezdaea aestivalis]